MKEGLIYLMQPVPFGGDEESLAPVKVGYTRDADTLHARKEALQIASPLPLRLCWVERGSKKREEKIHHRLAHLCSHREWFWPVEELESWLRFHVPPEVQDLSDDDPDFVIRCLRMMFSVQAPTEALEQVNGDWRREPGHVAERAG